MENELLIQAINLFNEIITGAKINDELPVQSPFNVNSKVRVSNSVLSETVTLKNIIDACVLASQNYIDRFVTVNGFTVTGNDVTVLQDWIWYINGLNLTNTTDQVISFTLCATGYNRIDKIVATNIGTFQRISGTEVVGTPFAPITPPNTLEVTFVTVTDTNITVSTPPTVVIVPRFLGFYPTKVDLEGGGQRPLVGDLAMVANGTVLEIAEGIDTTPYWRYYAVGGGSGSQSLEDVITVNPTTSKGFHITLGNITMSFNEVYGSIDLHDSGTNNRTIIFPDSIKSLNSTTGQYTEILKNGFEFKNKEGGERGYLNNKNSNFNQEVIYPIGTENKIVTFPFSVGGVFADQITGDIPITFPGTVDEILEFSDKDSFPVIGLANFYYLALDTNKTYRWSGSVYVVINEGIALGETNQTAYRGDRGKIAYDHTFDANIHVTITDKANWNAKADIADIPLIIATPYNSTFTYSTTTFTVPTNVLVQAVLNHNNTSQVVSFTQVGTTVTINNNCDTGDVIEVIGILNTDGSLAPVVQLELGETNQTAYRGDRGKIAYDHTFDGNIHVTTGDKSTWNGKQNALGFTPIAEAPNDVNSYVRSALGWVIGYTKSAIDTLLGNKVDKVSGSRLITSAESTILGNTSGANSGDNAPNTQYSGLATSKQDVPTQTTGAVISFTTQKQWNTIASPTASNITDNLTGAVIMTTQKIYHNSGTAPTFPAGWVKRGTGNYVTGVLNTIYAEWSVGTTVEYWITQ